MATAQPLSRRGVARLLKCRPEWLYEDNGHFATLLQWFKMYIPQWESEFRRVTKELVEMPDPAKILEVASKALNIDQDVLMYYAQHAEEIDIFLTTQRGLLARIAEIELWKHVQSGDAATIRWLLPRINPEVFGDQEKSMPSRSNQGSIKIIEVEGNI
jgi:hypothetical protein